MVQSSIPKRMNPRWKLRGLISSSSTNCSSGYWSLRTFNLILQRNISTRSSFCRYIFYLCKCIWMYPIAIIIYVNTLVNLHTLMVVCWQVFFTALYAYIWDIYASYSFIVIIYERLFDLIYRVRWGKVSLKPDNNQHL